MRCPVSSILSTFAWFWHLFASAAHPVVPVVDVFDQGEVGYYCIKIPYLTTLQGGRLLALAEGRLGSCTDYTKTDLVMKTSDDEGATWSALRVLHSGSEPKSTIGNAAPISVGGDVVVLFNENNLKVWMKRSKDLGETWSDAQEVSASTTLPEWKWVGLGPPAGLRLDSGRLLIPAYHTHLLPGTVDNGLISKGHALLSDDNGYTWRLSADHNFGGRFWPNECQAVELAGGRIAIFSRGLGFQRTRTISTDGGEHWGETELVDGLSEPVTGVEGSTISCRNGKRLVASLPVNTPIVRAKMTILVSDDEGATWKTHELVDPGASDYSALAWVGDRLGLLYGRSNETRVVFEPQRISFVSLPDPCDTRSSAVGAELLL